MIRPYKHLAYYIARNDILEPVPAFVSMLPSRIGLRSRKSFLIDIIKVLPVEPLKRSFVESLTVYFYQHYKYSIWIRFPFYPQ
ncbi:hypothetical protein MSP8886_00019 [Marinomonas spartinae]|uniref:Uncharacterized protein n=1 Tax=Marinomonas spartinae TaxID=1792290 RepID=A0A1A8SZG5_9GAMM|nr:hypothetical protein MSP8886_00019 [Marinomonas spartinae]